MDTRFRNKKYISPRSIGQKKFNEAIDLCYPGWIARFSEQIYDNKTHPRIKSNDPRPQKAKEPKEKTFDEQWEQEMEELRNLLL